MARLGPCQRGLWIFPTTRTTTWILGETLLSLLGQVVLLKGCFKLAHVAVFTWPTQQTTKIKRSLANGGAFGEAAVLELLLDLKASDVHFVSQALRWRKH